MLELRIPRDLLHFINTHRGDDSRAQYIIDLIRKEQQNEQDEKNDKQHHSGIRR